MLARPSNKVLNACVLSMNKDSCYKTADAIVHPLKLPVAVSQTPLSHTEMLRLYRSASVYVSSFRSEGFGLGTLEAMALGLQACYLSIIASANIVYCTCTPAND